MGRNTRVYPQPDARESVAGAFRAGARAALWCRAVLCAAVILCLVAGATAAGEPLTLDRIYSDPPLLSPLPAHVAWQGNSRGVSSVEPVTFEGESHKAFVVREVPSGHMRVLCIPDTMEVPADLSGDDVRFAIGAHEWSHDGRRVAFVFAGELFTLDAESGRITRRTNDRGEVRIPRFSPDDKRIGFARDNDLYVLDLKSGTETRLTLTGSESVLNGILDWVYMEELFTRSHVRAWWWSPDGKRIAFLQFQEDRVPEFPVVDTRPALPSYRLQRYPRPGDPLPQVRAGIILADGGDVVWADAEAGDDGYIARVYWLGDSRGVAIETLNRAQDNLQLLFASATTGRVEEVIQETDPFWVNVNYLKHYYEKKRQFVWGSERDGNSHLFLYNLDGTLIRQLTSGPWQVIALNGVNESKGRIYITANEKSVIERHLYEVREKDGSLRRITRSEGDHRVTMSPDTRYFLDVFSSPARPPRMAVCDTDGKELFVMGDQRNERFDNTDRPLPSFLQIESGGHMFHCMMYRPPGFDPMRKYPVIVYVYGGPHSQNVRKVWARHELWHNMMASRGYIVFSMDNRGTYGRGRAWENAIARNLGRAELEDQLAAAHYLASLPYVDTDRMGIWGWSYGGYMTLLAMMRAPGVFRAGAAVAPVTDWQLYDAIYTERYMKLPKENPDGYSDSTPLELVDGLEGDLLVMHGDVDDNVHLQNTMHLVRRLIDEGKYFDFMVYPGSLHGVKATADRRHLYETMARFFDRHLLAPIDTSATTPQPAAR